MATHSKRDATASSEPTTFDVFRVEVKKVGEVELSGLGWEDPVQVAFGLAGEDYVSNRKADLLETSYQFKLGTVKFTLDVKAEVDE